MRDLGQPGFSPGTRPVAVLVAALGLLAAGWVDAGAQDRTGPRQALPGAPELKRLDLSNPGFAPIDGLSLSQLASSPRLEPERRETPRSFYRDRLLPELQRQVDRTLPYETTYVPVFGGTLTDTVFYDEWRDTTARSCSRSVRRAMQNYLLESSPVLDKFSRSVRATGDRLDGIHRSSELDLGLGVSSGLPEIGLRYRAGEAYLRFDVRVDGSVGLEFRHNRSARKSLSAGYDADENRYGLSYRMSF